MVLHIYSSAVSITVYTIADTTKKISKKQSRILNSKLAEISSQSQFNIFL